MNDFQHHLERSIALVQQGSFNQAETLLKTLLRQFPEHPMPNHLMGIVQLQLGLRADAEKYMRQTLRVAPDFMPARNNLAALLTGEKRFDEAVAILKEVIQRQPEYVDAYGNLAAIYLDQGDNNAALEALNTGLRRAPDHPNLLNLKSIVLRRKGDLEQALAMLERVLQLQPSHADALSNIGQLALRVGNAEYAVKALNAALTVFPSNTRLLVDLAAAHLQLNQIDEALSYCKTALSRLPNDPACLYQYAVTLARDGQHQAADTLYQQVLQQQPDHLDALKSRLFLTNYLPDISAQEAFKAHVEWARHFKAALPPSGVAAPALRKRGQNDPITIGFVSGDFYHHVVTFFFLPLVRHYDKSKFRFVCYFNRHKGDETSELLASLVDRFVNIANMNDDDVIAAMHQDQIDILIDMSGHTSNNRLSVFARKPVAIQMSWLAYPNTTGLTEIDYRVTDPLVEPLSAQRYSAEQLLFMDQGFLCFEWMDAKAVNTSKIAGSTGITFGSFNNFRKVNAELIALWAQILRETESSRLVVKYDQLSNASTRERVLQMFADHGVSPERIELVGRLASYREHLEYYRHIDIALDTYPYNGTTTTLEALNMGVPVVTLSGTSHASRVGMAILSRLGLSDLIATSPDEYVQCAKKLALNRPRLEHLQATLGDRVRASHLMQGKEFARAFESLLRETHQRHISLAS